MYLLQVTVMYTYITICAIYNVYSYYHGITFLSFNPHWTRISHCCDKMSDKGQLEEEELIVAHSL